MNTSGTQNTQNTQSTNPVTSEIARLIEQWDAEAEATQLALKGYAITARHSFITQRMQTFGDEKLIDMMRLEAEKMNAANKVQSNTSSDETAVRGESKEL